MFALILTGCQTSDPSGPETGSIFSGAFGDMQARSEGNNPGYGDLTGRQAPGAGGTVVQNFRSDGSTSARGLTMATPTTSEGGGSYTLNFENADIKDVVRAVLNDALKVNYVVSGNVTGPVTLSSTRPVSRAELLSTLETALDSLGFSLTREGETYRISPSGSSGALVDVGTRTRLGYGVSVVPLRFVKASTMMELLSGFVAQGENLKIDASKNTIFIRGSGAERQAAVNAVLSFDDDWMENQSVSVFTLQEAKPEAIIPELQRIFGASGDDAAIQFRSIDRLRSILAISQNPKLITRAGTWVRRLDRENPGIGEGVFVYKPKHRSAEDLAKVLSSLFGGGGGQSPARPTRQAASLSGASPDGSEGGSDGFSTAGEGGNSRVSSAFDTANGTGADFGSGTAPGVIDMTSQPQGGGGGGSGIRISADPSNNSVVTYADADVYQKVLVALRQLDSTPQQVAVNVTIAEVQLTDALKYGVQYYVNSHGVGFNNSNNQSISVKDVASSVVQSQIPGFNFLLGTNSDPDVIISALSVISNVEILSSPSLVVVENQTATLQVGDQVPVTTRQAQSVENGLAPLVNQVEFRDTGIILNVTPRIGQNDAVTMNVEQEISAVVQGSNTLTPTISKRRVASQISVQNGQTVLLAGLISAQARKGNSGVPGTRNIPVLGTLLGQTDNSANRTELIMLIRPTVVRSSQDAASVAAELKSQMWGMGMRSTPSK
ncbi:type II secretion system secretin GspD [Aureimonas sp. AU12]|uniref:type II secretion system secretin GspD n=1 Tax=Aureimonas sp. AU12 TaxID=1638161 RepID=UPI000785D6EF|nr:type II secretion system secretin GspD [Aureimonas sp. AU12]